MSISTCMHISVIILRGHWYIVEAELIFSMDLELDSDEEIHMKIAMCAYIYMSIYECIFKCVHIYV